MSELLSVYEKQVLREQVSLNFKMFIQRYLEDNKMSARALATVLGIDRQMISNYLTKNTNPSLETLMIFSKRLNVSFDEMILSFEAERSMKQEILPSPVVRVVDGDTIIVQYEGVEERVRLIGIDTPESVHPDRSKNTEAGVTASDYVKVLLADKSVYLEFDKQKRDRYGRLLAYVYLANGTFINAHLLEMGYANITTFKPNIAHLPLFESIVGEISEIQEEKKCE